MPPDVQPEIHHELAELIRTLTAGRASLVEDSLAPLPGGYDTEVFGFEVAGQSGLPARLVLRVFRANESMRAPIEAIVQNWAADSGLPAPRVYAGFGGERIDGRPFTLMTRMPGETLLASIGNPALVASLPVTLASVQRELHAIDPHGLMASLRHAHLADRVIGPAEVLADTSRFDAGPGFTRLLDWLSAHAPGPTTHPVVCHGDLHPGNVLVDGATVTGIIDWGGFIFASAEADVAITRIIISCAGRLDPSFDASMWALLEQMADSYTRAYEQYVPLDQDLIAWCETLRAAHAIGQVLANDAVRPLQGYAWGEPAVFDALTALVQRHTGIEITREP